MRYRIVQANDPERLSEQVEKLLNDRWKLHGNLLLTTSLYTQALVNEQNSPVATQMLDSEEVRLLQNVFSNTVSLNPEQQQLRERADQILSKLAERAAESGDAESLKE